MKIRVLINHAAHAALVASGANPDAAEWLDNGDAGDFCFIDLDQDVWDQLLRMMAGEWEACEDSHEEAECVSRAILRLTSGQIGHA